MDVTDHAQYISQRFTSKAHRRHLHILFVPAMGWEGAWASGLEVTKCLSDTSDLTVVSCFHELEDLWLDMSLARVPSDMGVIHCAV